VLELWFDFSCPYAYLASRKAPAIARAAGVELVWKPMLLGGVFRGIGAGAGPMATLGAAKALHNVRDMHRWAEIFGAPFRMPAAHPMRTVRALRTLLALPHERWQTAIDAIYAAYWQRGEDITQDAVILAALAEIPEAASALARADDFKQDLIDRTDAAIALGIFGAPAWVANGTLIWGQDRMPWVEAVLAGWNPDTTPPPGGPRPVGTGAQGFRSPRTLELYFDVASPFAYLALTQLRALGELTGTMPRLRPILLGGLFRAIGQVDVPIAQMSQAKQRYTLRELDRWARWWGVPFDWPKKFPQRTITAQRLCVLAGDDPTLAIALGRAMWAEQRDLEDPEVLREVLAGANLPREWLERTAEPAVKAKLVAEGEAAIAAGAFGVPTFVVDGRHLVWGQDRMDLVVRMLGGWDPA
jgi:2-hydroxychromene-2-carboxylate isomerase